MSPGAASGMNQLRRAVRALDNCREDFLDRFTAIQLLRLHRMWVASDWGIAPDTWEARQVAEALRGVPPRFDDSERAVYT